jgi:hypothetical protein
MRPATAPAAGRNDAGRGHPRVHAVAVVVEAVGPLTTGPHVGIVANVEAELLQRDRFVFDDGAILEMVIWRVPKPVEGSKHPYKYRLFYGRPGRRMVGYDNERPKGDHRHFGASETPYRFTNVETLVRDFLVDVTQRRSK